MTIRHWKWAALTALLLKLDVLHAQRLSDWLLAQPADPTAYPLGVQWQVPEERVAQGELRQQLLEALATGETAANPDSRARLRAWLSGLPVTGRTPVAVGDARWLQANTAQDPVLGVSDRVVLPQRPSSVTVLLPDGQRCAVAYQPDLSARDALHTCQGEAGVDWLYVAQPDGHLQRWGVAAWNADDPAQPLAPGAWIWAPPRHAGWSTAFSEGLIAFLATQGPAPDAEAPAVLPVRMAPPAPGRGPRPTANDWGEIGLLQMPSARMRPAGDFDFTYSQVQPYSRANVFFQPFDGMEAGFRYTTINNRLYGPTSLSGNQNYVDKSMDVKFGLTEESAWLPQTVVGFRDVAGTGLFSGEYLAASKRTGAIDWTAGLGWGYLGGRADMANPLSLLGSSFNTRGGQYAGGSGGNFAFNSYFHGRTAPFGGLEYQTPWKDLIVKLEYDGNNYQNDPLSNVLPVRSPINAGAVYRLSDAADLTVGYERGNTALLALSLHSSLKDMGGSIKPDDPLPVAVRPMASNADPDWTQTRRDVESQTQWHVRSIVAQGNTLVVTVEDATQAYLKSYLDRALAVLHRDAPAHFTRFVVRYQQHGHIIARHRIDRALWVKQRTQPLPASRSGAALVGSAEPQGLHLTARQLPPLSSDETDAEPASGASGASLLPGMTQALDVNKAPTFEAHAGLNVNYFMGGPNGLLLYEIAPSETALWRINENTWVDGVAQYNAFNNYNHFTYDAPSNMPRVRTYLREYLTTSRLNLTNTQLTHFGQLSENQYYTVYGGYLEEMFGGIGGEWMYRPYASRTAWSVDVNEVRQRNFAQDFGFRNYQVATGHARLYWDTGWNDLLATISVGRYLAGDVGATIDVSRAFRNGVRIGAFMTRTNVSAAQFGEGSFDKGVYVSIPFDALLTQSSPTYANFLWKPLIRDGGAMLSRQVWLYDLTNNRSNRLLTQTPAPPEPTQVNPEKAQPDWVPQLALPPVAATHTVVQPSLSQWQATPQPFADRLQQALTSQGYRNITIQQDGGNLTVVLSNADLRPLSRVVGQAARTALKMAALDLSSLHVQVIDRVRYDFDSIPTLKAYFAGQADRQALAPTLHVFYFNPSFREPDPLARLSDLGPLPAVDLADVVFPGFHPIDRALSDLGQAGHEAAQTDWLSTGAAGVGLILGSAVFDNAGNRFAIDHGTNRYLVAERTFGNAFPWVASAGIGATALLATDPVLSRTAYASSEAAVSSFVSVLFLKKLVGRARPWTNLGDHSFHPLKGSSGNGTDSFPSGHTIVTWAELTPFALEYDRPELYGLALLVNGARVTGRNHWVSDTVTSSFLGYGLGKWFWQANQRWTTYAPDVSVAPGGVNFHWSFH